MGLFDLGKVKGSPKMEKLALGATKVEMLPQWKNMLCQFCGKCEKYQIWCRHIWHHCINANLNVLLFSDGFDNCFANVPIACIHPFL